MRIIELSDSDMALIRKNAELCDFSNLPSNVRSMDDKKKNNRNDQITGQSCEAALSYLLTGSIDLYRKTREERNKDPYSGDKGSDLIGMRVNAKGGRMRFGRDFPYKLFVRDKEYYPDVMYYFMLMDDKVDNIVYAVGTIMGRDMPPPVNGRRDIPQDLLEPI